MLQVAEPVSLFQEFGPYVGGVIVCAGLVIWNTIQMSSLGKDIEANTKTITDGIKDLRAQIEELTDEIRNQGQNLHQTLESMSAKQDVLAANQNAVMTNLQVVLQQLITIIGGK